MADLHLSFAMTAYDRVMPLITGEVKPAGKRLFVLRHDEDLLCVRVFCFVAGFVSGHVNHPSIRIDAVDVARASRHRPGDWKLRRLTRGNVRSGRR